MAMMTKGLAEVMTSDLRAEIVMTLDNYLRGVLYDEDLFARWLEMGVPDGTGCWRELGHVSAGELTEMWNLAEELVNEQLVKDSKWN